MASVMDKAADDFWHAFGVEAVSLATRIAAGNLREAFQRVETLLKKHGFDFCFDLTQEGCDAVLVLTPEGDPEQARGIDRLVQARPELAGWRVYGRRQRKPLHDAFAFVWHVYGLDVRDATFDLRETPRGYEVTMHSKAVEGLTAREAEGLAATFLDHAVGESVVMARIAGLFTRDGAGDLSPVALVTYLVGH